MSIQLVRKINLKQRKMTTIQFIKRIKQIRDELIEERPKEVLLIANDMLALTKLRIQTTGTDSNNQPFEEYTTPYKKERIRRGASASRVDFTLTGAMFRNIIPRITNETKETTTVTIKAGNKAQQDKLDGQFKKRGNILSPTKEELDFLQQLLTERLQNKLNGL